METNIRPLPGANAIPRRQRRQPQTPRRNPRNRNSEGIAASLRHATHAAVRDRLEGRVLFRLTSDAEGRVGAVEIVASSGHAILDNAAIAGVKSWRAEPARLLGRPVATTAILPVQFQLH